MSGERRVGLLGGTFDPPHVGHLVVAESARVDLDLDEVRLLVAGDPWMKRTVASAADRVAMVRAAVDGDPHLVADDRETRRDGPTYTADTLEQLDGEEPGATWYFLLGTDAAARLGEWHRVDEALALGRFVLVERPGDDRAPEAAYAGRLTHLPVPALEISSTDLRARYAAGRATRYLVPEAVDRYVRSNRLYGVDA